MRLPSKTAAGRLSAALLDQFGTTVKPGKLEVLDIDDTFCAAHGGQQLAFWNAHHDERGFASMHIYHVASGTPVAAILRPARTPKGSEVRTVIKHATKRLRRHWPKTRIVWRGYGRVEAMEWAEEHAADYILGLAGNAALDALVAETAVNLRFHHAMSSKAKLRTYVSFLYQAGSWRRPRKVVARLECSLQPGAGEPNPGRRSTYRCGKIVQTTGTSSKIDGAEYLIMKESDVMGVLTETEAGRKAA